jgi:hypothetical protein
VNFLRTVLAELVGLFVDDWAFALLLILWVGLAAVFGPRLPSSVAAPLLFLGLAVLTLTFAVRQAQRLRSQKQ